MKTIYQSTLRSISIFIICILLGCSKSDDASLIASSASKTQLITASDWVLIGQQEKVSPSTDWKDTYGSLTACEKDDRTSFKSNGNIETNEGATKCNASDPQVTNTGTWSFFNNETILVVKNLNSTQVDNYTIETLTANSLIISYTEVFNGITYQDRYLFSH
jgi:Lipocalin-like domain